MLLELFERRETDNILDSTLEKCREIFSLSEYQIIEKIVKEFYRVVSVYPGSVKGHHSEEGGLFKHSVEVAIGSAESVFSDRLYVFLAGLFHDVGKIYRYRFKDEERLDFKRGFSDCREYTMQDVRLETISNEYEYILSIAVISVILERAGFFESEFYDEKKFFELLTNLKSDFKSENGEENVVKQADIDSARSGLEESFQEGENIDILLDVAVTQAITVKRMNYDYFVSKGAIFVTEDCLNFILSEIQRRSKKYVSKKILHKLLLERRLLKKPERYEVEIYNRKKQLVLYRLDTKPGIYFTDVEEIAVTVRKLSFEDSSYRKISEEQVAILANVSDIDKFLEIIEELQAKMSQYEIIANYHVYLCREGSNRFLFITMRGFEKLESLQRYVEREYISPVVKKIKDRKRVKTLQGYCLPVEIFDEKIINKEFREVEVVF